MVLVVLRCRYGVGSCCGGSGCGIGMVLVVVASSGAMLVVTLFNRAVPFFVNLLIDGTQHTHARVAIYSTIIPFPIRTAVLFPYAPHLFLLFFFGNVFGGVAFLFLFFSNQFHSTARFSRPRDTPAIPDTSPAAYRPNLRLRERERGRIIKLRLLPIERIHPCELPIDRSNVISLYTQLHVAYY